MPYIASAPLLSGSNYKEIAKQARLVYRDIAKQTKRRAYVRSAYYKKEKIFFEYYWQHLSQKALVYRTTRLRYLACAIELIRYSRIEPTVKINPNRHHELLYRFTGQTRDGKRFYVQIKENRKTKQKYFMSVFPETKNLPPD